MPGGSAAPSGELVDGRVASDSPDSASGFMSATAVAEVVRGAAAAADDVADGEEDR